MMVKGWRKFPLSDPGFASQTGGISAVSRSRGAMEIWTTGKVNEPSGNYHYSTDGYYWYENANWNKYNLDFKPAPSLVNRMISILMRHGFQMATNRRVQPAFLQKSWMPVYHFMNNRIFLYYHERKKFILSGCMKNELGPAVEQEGPPVAGKEDVDQFVLPYGNRILVVTKNGDVWGHPVAGNNIDQAYPLSGDKLICWLLQPETVLRWWGRNLPFLTIENIILWYYWKRRCTQIWNHGECHFVIAPQRP